MKNNKHRDDSRPSMLVTKSKRYWAGSKRNKPKHGTSTKDKGLCVWENNLDLKADRLVEQLSVYKFLFDEVAYFRHYFGDRYAKVVKYNYVKDYTDGDVRVTTALHEKLERLNHNA